MSFKFGATFVNERRLLAIACEESSKMMRYRSFGEGTGVLLSVIGQGGSGCGRIHGEYDEETAPALGKPES